HQHVVAPGTMEVAHVHRYRLGPADQRRAADHRDERKQNRADRIGVHERIERHTAEQARRRIAEAIRRPRVRHFMYRQREQQNDERDEDLRDVDARQASQGYGRLAKNARTASAAFAPTTAARSSRVARRTPATLPNDVSNVLRRPGPVPGTSSSSDRRSRIVRARRWNVTANRCASSRMRCISNNAGSLAASAIGSSRSRVWINSSFFAMPTATRFARPSSSSAAYAADS